MLLPRQWGSNKSGDTMSAPCIGRHQFKGRGVSSRMCHVLEAPSSEVYAQSQWGTWWHLVILVTSGSYPNKSPDILRQSEVSLQKMFEVWWSVMKCVKWVVNQYMNPRFGHPREVSSAVVQFFWHAWRVFAGYSALSHCWACTLWQAATDERKRKRPGQHL